MIIQIFMLDNLISVEILHIMQKKKIIFLHPIVFTVFQ